jgi:hypothetical protein
VEVRINTDVQPEIGWLGWLQRLVRLSQRVLDEQWTDAALAARGIETAEQWWEALALEPAFVQLLTERTRRLAGKQRQESPPGFDVKPPARIVIAFFDRPCAA